MRRKDRNGLFNNPGSNSYTASQTFQHTRTIKKHPILDRVST